MSLKVGKIVNGLAMWCVLISSALRYILAWHAWTKLCTFKTLHLLPLIPQHVMLGLVSRFAIGFWCRLVLDFYWLAKWRFSRTSFFKPMKKLFVTSEWFNNSFDQSPHAPCKQSNGSLPFYATNLTSFSSKGWLFSTVDYVM